MIQTRNIYKFKKATDGMEGHVLDSFLVSSKEMGNRMCYADEWIKAVFDGELRSDSLMGEASSGGILMVGGPGMHKMPTSIRHLNILGLDIREMSEGMSKDLRGIVEMISSIEGLRHLRIDGENIKSIPNNITTLQNLETLIVTETRVKTLPRNLNKLKELRKLVAIRGDIRKIPRSLYKLDKLEILHLGGNKITRVSQKLFKMKAIHEINLNQNNIIKNRGTDGWVENVLFVLESP